MNNKFRGIYLVTETNLVGSKTGAGQHIAVGLKYLNHYFDIILLENKSTKLNKSTSKSSNTQDGANIVYDKNKIRGALRDIKTLLKNLSSLAQLYFKIKKLSPDFIYERSNYLNPNGLIISKILNIPHFYENNGIAVEYYHKTYYASYLHRCFLWFEKKMYDLSNFVFYVGSWGLFFNSSKKNWINIENGIESEIIDQFIEFEREITNKINIGFIGNPMAHHGLDLFISALNEIKIDKPANLHFIGPGFDKFISQIKNEKFQIINHGFIPRENIIDVLKLVDVGMIPNAPEYPSLMKIFDYGVAKSLVICPNTINLKFWFEDNEVYFFEKGNKESLKNAIVESCVNPTLIKSRGERIFKKIKKAYSWENIFEIISSKMNLIIENDESSSNT